ncbi:MAG: hypothetical protein IPK26_07525 [Planctomycetes bacterium]|nr:hypothetical protein [Planctomycetota bacterium]
MRRRRLPPPPPPILAAIVVDGANVIAHDGARACERLELAERWCQEFAPRLPVFVGIDAATATHLRQPQFQAQGQRLAAALAAGRWHVCPAEMPADAFLLQKARELAALVLSNDRFADHEELRRNAMVLQFTIAGDRFMPAAEATWFRWPGHSRRQAVRQLLATSDTMTTPAPPGHFDQ